MSDAVAGALAQLRAAASPARRDGQARVGINIERALGVAVPDIRRVARQLGPDHELAAALWGTGVHEARILATMIDVPTSVTAEQMERWARDCDSWDLVDCAVELFERTPFAWDAIPAWAQAGEEFVARAAFSLIAVMAVHRKAVPDERFAALLPIIRTAAGDERRYVRKAVNWALRNIGKRSAALRRDAMACAEQILADGTRGGRWVARDALRELRDPAPSVRARLERET